MISGPHKIYCTLGRMRQPSVSLHMGMLIHEFLMVKLPEAKGENYLFAVHKYWPVGCCIEEPFNGLANSRRATPRSHKME